LQYIAARIKIDAIVEQMIRHALWIAMIPGIKTASEALPAPVFPE